MTPLEIRLAAYGAIALLLGSTCLGGWLYVHHLQSDVKTAQAATAVALAQDKHDAAQSALSTAVAPVVAAGAAKLAITVQTQQDNSNALATAPGAAAPIDPALLATAIAGLCRYNAYAGAPGCAPVPAADPPVVQPTH